MTEYDAILFDNDGVLVEPPSDETLLTAAQAAFDAVGIENPDDGHVSDVVRGVTPDLLEKVCAAYDVDQHEFWRARDTHASEAQVAGFRAGDRGPYDDVAAIEDLAHDFGIVSSNQHRTIEFVLDFCEFADLFDTYYGRDMGVEDLRRKKPDPTSSNARWRISEPKPPFSSATARATWRRPGAQVWTRRWSSANTARAWSYRSNRRTKSRTCTASQR
jgi:phosphoglycolate phosphatase-like HAD superfamily hydrolase